MSPDVAVEVAVQDVRGVLLARAGGADRVEFCSGLALGGLTPSSAAVEAAVHAAQGMPVHVLVRCRTGEFRYDRDEVRLMAREIADACSAGAEGVVVGALDERGGIDVAAMRAWAEAAAGRSLTLHRAMDLAGDAERALEAAVDAGCGRVLTSGQAVDALAGVPTLRRLVERAAGRLEVMAGGGVRAANAGEIIARTGVPAVHLSAARTVAHQGMQGGAGPLPLGAAAEQAASRTLPDPDVVAAVVREARTARSREVRG